MTEERRHEEVRSRNEDFVEKTVTRIWDEIPSDNNPYIAKNINCHGYNLFELAEKRSFVDVFFLIFKGELPSVNDSNLLEMLMVFLINPGPRHDATRAAMNAGVGKTETTHILPIASAVMGGEHHGAGSVEKSMRYFRRCQKKPPKEISHALLEGLPCGHDAIETLDSTSEYFSEKAPGFGHIYGGLDIVAKNMSAALANMPGAGKALMWGNQFSRDLEKHGFGWLTFGLAAAVFADLGFHPRYGASIFQLLSAPGMVAHGLELANKPITSMPYVKDENYVIKR